MMIKCIMFFLETTNLHLVVNQNVQKRLAHYKHTFYITLSNLSGPNIFRDLLN